jgi:hypothetical protein
MVSANKKVVVVIPIHSESPSVFELIFSAMFQNTKQSFN